MVSHPPVLRHGRVRHVRAMVPKIGIPPCLDASERIRAGRRTHYLDVRYAECLAEAGALPFYLPAPAAPAAAIEALDGLLLPGGDDFPSPTPLPPEARLDPAAPEQIRYDTALLSAALERGIPVLGVCYGMQLLALHYGGTLIHDLATQAPSAREHRLPESETHPIRVAAGSRLADVLGPEPRPVNSLHHQAVADAGRLSAVAWAEDDCIEAVEDPDRDGFVVGVQWHPEKLRPEERRPLFEAFVAATRR